MPQIFFAFPYEFDRTLPDYRAALRGVTQDQRLDAVFANEVQTPDFILSNIVGHIENSDAAFFDMTDLNPNVLIEYGVGKGLKKPCFILLRVGRKGKSTEANLPVDLRGQQRLDYTDLDELRDRVRAAIHGHVLPPIRASEARRRQLIAHVQTAGKATKSQVRQALGLSFEEAEGHLDALTEQGVLTRRLVREGHARRYEYELALN